jgi:hypothetical protein
MIKNKYFGILLTAVMIFSITGCEKWIDQDINIDPNNPVDAPMSLLLPSVQTYLGFTLGGDIGRYTGVITQHYAGVARQHAGIDRYVFSEADVNNAWRFNMYTGSLMDLHILIQKSTNADAPSPLYEGVGKILMAMNLGIATDLWGSIPYAEAFQGLDNLQPSFQTQEQIYIEIQKLLTEGKNALNQQTSTFTPSSDDLVYKATNVTNWRTNSLPRWVKAANVLSARYWIHLSQVQTDAAQKALDALGVEGVDHFGSNADDAQVVFGENLSNSNPMYQFMRDRGDIAMGKFFIDLMKSTDDPRLPAFASEDKDSSYSGSPAGSPTPGRSEPGPTTFYGAATSPVPFVTYVEAKFIEAEAAFRTNDPTRAAQAYNKALVASLAKHNVSNTAWETLNANETSLTISLEKIMNQKYIALFSQMETFNDWRRTGFPNLQPAANNVTNNQIPVRFPYPQSERLYNSANMPTGVGILTPVWWDVP